MDKDTIFIDHKQRRNKKSDELSHLGKTPKNFGGMSHNNLDEADGIEIIMREIGKLTQLRRLGITKLRREDGMDLCSSLGKLTNLRSLYISCIDEDEVKDSDQSLSSSPLPFLRKVFLKGRLEKFPQCVCSLDGLAELQLSWSRLRDLKLVEFTKMSERFIRRLSMQKHGGDQLVWKLAHVSEVVLFLFGCVIILFYF